MSHDPERGVRSNAMVVYLQVAILSGNERNGKIMHDCAPLVGDSVSRDSRHAYSFFFPIKPPNLEVLGTYQPIFLSAWELGYLSGPEGCFRHASLAQVNFTRRLLEVQILCLH